jgi:hypothetical protein
MYIHVVENSNSHGLQQGEDFNFMSISIFRQYCITLQIITVLKIALCFLHMKEQTKPYLVRLGLAVLQRFLCTATIQLNQVREYTLLDIDLIRR